MPDFETIGIVVGAALTLLTFSYLLGDNFLYRLTLHVFAGALTGYALGVVVRGLGEMVQDSLQNNDFIVFFPFLMGLVLLFTKSIRRLTYIGNLPLAYLVGVGVAVAFWGALRGTLLPQVEATASALSFRNLVGGLTIVGGTVCTLMAFDFTLTQKRRGLISVLGKPIGWLGWLGRGFLTITLGVTFAGALTASLSVFIGRTHYFIEAAEKFVELLRDLGLQ